MTESLQQLLNQILEFAPRFFSALIITLLGFFIAKIASKAMQKLLQAIKLDTLGEKLNDIDFISRANLEIKLSVIVGKVIYYFLVLIFLIMAADILAMPAITQMFQDLFNLIPKLMVGFFILVFGSILSDMLRKLVDTTMRSLGISAHQMISSFIFYFLLINVVVVAIDQAEIDTDFFQQNISILIAGGVLAFAIGYGIASKDVMGNLLSSLYTRDKLAIGDFIALEGEEGEIIDMDKTSLTLAASGKRIIIPLKSVLNSKVTIINDKRLTT